MTAGVAFHMIPAYIVLWKVPVKVAVSPSFNEVCMSTIQA